MKDADDKGQWLINNEGEIVRPHTARDKIEFFGKLILIA